VGKVLKELDDEDSDAAGDINLRGAVEEVIAWVAENKQIATKDDITDRHHHLELLWEQTSSSSLFS